jgi:uncharacterized protein
MGYAIPQGRWTGRDPSAGHWPVSTQTGRAPETKDRFATSPYGESGQHYLCPSYKAFFHHVQRPMSMMADLLARNRAPAELMQTYAAEDAARGRNEPCTCGSGRKWKSCHGG